MKRPLSLIAFLVLSLSACAPAGPSGPIKLGYIGPLTGDAASYGMDTVNGVKIAVAEINAAGGINGRQIELLAEDGRCNGTDAASAAQKLINVDHVTAIVGGQCSGETLAAAPIAEAAKVVMVSPVSSSPDVTKAGDYIFRDYPSDALKTKAMAKVFAEKGYKKMAILTENTDFATAFRDSLVSNVGSDAVAFNETVEPGTKDFRTLMTRLKDVKFDIFVPNSQTDASIAAEMQQLREAGITQPAISHDVADSVTLGEIAKDAVEGLQVVSISSKLGEGGTDSFATHFRAKYGEPQANLSFATLAYDAANLLAKAIAAVGTDGPALQKYLTEMPSYEGAAGSFHFDANGDVVGIGYVMKEFHDGKIGEVGIVPME